MKYILRDHNQNQYGPLTEITVENLYMDGVINHLSQVFDSTIGSWVPFDQVFGNRAWAKNQEQVKGSDTSNILNPTANQLIQPPFLPDPIPVGIPLEAKQVPNEQHASRPSLFGWGWPTKIAYTLLLLLFIKGHVFNDGPFINFTISFIVAFLSAEVLRLPYFLCSKFLSKKLSALVTTVLWGLMIGSLFGYILYDQKQTEEAIKDNRDVSNLASQQLSGWLSLALPKGLRQLTLEKDLDQRSMNFCRSFHATDEKVDVTVTLYEFKSGFKLNPDSLMDFHRKTLDGIFGPGEWVERPSEPAGYGEGIGNETYFIESSHPGKTFRVMKVVTLTLPSKKGLPLRAIKIVMLSKARYENSQFQAICKSISFTGV